MSNKSFWNGLGDSISFILFCKYGIPILIVVFGIFFVNQLIYSTAKHNEYKDMNNVIFTSKQEESTLKIAKDLYDTEVFSSVELNTSSNFGDRIEYIFKNSDKSAEEYDKLAKEEITKVYDAIKDKRFISDQIFGNTDRRVVKLFFYCPQTDKGKKFLCSAELIYYNDKGFDKNTYENIINNDLVTEKIMNMQ